MFSSSKSDAHREQNNGNTSQGSNGKNWKRNLKMRRPKHHCGLCVQHARTGPILEHAVVSARPDDRPVVLEDNAHSARCGCRLSRFTIVSLNRWFSLVQPHYSAGRERAIETGQHDHGEVHSPSEIKAAGIIVRGNMGRGGCKKTFTAPGDARRGSPRTARE
ncbi:MAG: hypothetical protein JWR69_883 [Pedosphaera sp.]|nr:hypothetical protein [Pedosphaera sp.]